MSESIRRNIRRTHEIEFIIQKYARATTCADSFEVRFQELVEKVNQNAAIYDE